MMKQASLVLFLLVGTFLLSCNAQANLCFLATNGTNTNNSNCTQSSPCKTIKNCLETFSTSGGQLNIQMSGGQYNDADDCGISVNNFSNSGFTAVVVQSVSGPVTINCNGQTSGHFHFYDVPVSLTLQGLTLAQGTYAGKGGCVYASNITSLTVLSSTFVGCNATSSNGGSGHGGAIYSTVPTTIDGSIFTANEAAQNGGAIYLNPAANVQTSIAINNTVISGNTASNGAGLFVIADFASVESTNITFNSALSYGGGLYLQANQAETAYPMAYDFVGTQITNNTGFIGGGIYASNLNHSWNIIGAFLQDNKASSISGDANVACGDDLSLFCYACQAQDCSTDCVLGVGYNQSCALNATSGTSVCYTSNPSFTTCSGNTTLSSDCACTPSSGLPKSAKILIAVIIVCLAAGILLIVVGVVLTIRDRKTKGYTPIK